MNGFGLNAAVQAFPQAYEFGRSLVGQDNATQERLFKQQLARDELALRQQQADQENTYKLGILDAQRYNNETQRSAEEARAKYLGIQGNQINTMLPHEVSQSDAKTGNIWADTRSTLETLPGKVGYQAALINQADASTQNLTSEADARRYKLDRTQREGRYTDSLPKLIVDPWDTSVHPDDRKRWFTELGVMANPNAGPAVELFDKAVEHYKSTGKKDLFNDELKQTMGAALQPLIDQNTNAPPGSYRFVEFEQAPGGTLMKLQQVDPASGQPVSSAPVYVTNGRVPMAEGGVPTVFTQGDIHHVLSGLRRADDWQKANPEMAQEGQNILADRAGSDDPAVYSRNRTARVKALIAKEKDADKKAKLEQKESERLRSSLAKEAMEKIDAMSGYNEKDFEETNLMTGNKTRNVSAIQRLKKFRQDIMADISSRLQKATLEDLYGLTGDGIVGSSALRAQLHGYNAAIRQQGGSESTYTPPAQGGIQNSSAYGR